HLTPIELLNIVLHLASSAVSVAQRTLLRQRIGEKTTVISGMTVQAQMERTITCPFLLENRCSIYAVRPLLCRGRNSFDATPCQAVYADPTQAGQFVLLQEQMLVSQCLVLGILTALKKIGLPDRCIDLCLALDVSLRNPDMVERWLQGEDPLLAC
ncbi:MAG TPA: YkgJ family cysteine cluster protein, partial [Armatimonadota bacterium]